jgi:hypothetical protein
MMVAGANSAFSMGAIYATLPAGSKMASVHRQTHCLSANTWFVAYSANGVYYRVVPAP